MSESTASSLSICPATCQPESGSEPLLHPCPICGTALPADRVFCGTLCQAIDLLQTMATASRGHEKQAQSPNRDFWRGRATGLDAAVRVLRSLSLISIPPDFDPEYESFVVALTGQVGHA